MPLTRDETRGSGLAVAIDLVNTWDELEPEPDLIEGLEDVRTWLEWHGLSAAAKRLTAADVDRVRALRARFDGSSTPAARTRRRASSTSSCASTGRRRYSSAPAAAGASGTWPDESEGLPAVAAYATAGLLDAFQELGWARFGRCAGAPCRCAYVDRSRNRHAATAAPSAPTVSPRRSTARADRSVPPREGRGGTRGQEELESPSQVAGNWFGSWCPVDFTIESGVFTSCGSAM